MNVTDYLIQGAFATVLGVLVHFYKKLETKTNKEIGELREKSDKCEADRKVLHQQFNDANKEIEGLKTKLDILNKMCPVESCPFSSFVSK